MNHCTESTEGYDQAQSLQYFFAIWDNRYLIFGHKNPNINGRDNVVEQLIRYDYIGIIFTIFQPLLTAVV